MSLAWETTEEDVMNVLNRMGLESNDEKVQHWIDRIDHDKVEKEALRGDDMCEQIEFAYSEIEEQILYLS